MRHRRGLHVQEVLLRRVSLRPILLRWMLLRRKLRMHLRWMFFFMGPRVPYQLQVVLCGAFPEPFVAAGSASSYSPLYALPSPRHRVWLVPEALCESSFC